MQSDRIRYLEVHFYGKALPTVVERIKANRLRALVHRLTNDDFDRDMGAFVAALKLSKTLNAIKYASKAA